MKRSCENRNKNLGPRHKVRKLNTTEGDYTELAREIKQQDTALLKLEGSYTWWYRIVLVSTDSVMVQRGFEHTRVLLQEWHRIFRRFP